MYKNITLTYSDFKTNILQEKSIQHKYNLVTKGSNKYYELYTFDGIDLIKCFINSVDNGSDVTDYETNYKDAAIILFHKQDADGKPLTNPKMVHGKFKEIFMYITAGSDSVVVNNHNSMFDDIFATKIFPCNQNGDLTTSSAIVTNLTNTAKFDIGVAVSGTGIPADTTIESIDSATQITLNNDATATGASALTFSKTTAETQTIISPNFNYDIDGGGFSVIGTKPTNDMFMYCVMAPYIPEVYGGDFAYIDGKKITMDNQDYHIITDPKYIIYNASMPTASQILVLIKHNIADTIEIEVRLRLYT